MKNTNPNSDHNPSEKWAAVGTPKLPEQNWYLEFWVKTNLANHLEINITWATKLQMEWFKKGIKAKTIRNNFDEGKLAKLPL